MKHRFLAHDPDARSLTIFFAGWGSSPERFRDLRPAGGQDLFLLWDFNGAVGALPDLSRYETVDVVGWSLGVRIAADWVMESPVPVRRFTAVAGTLTPIDRRLGIPPVVFDRTTDRFGEATLEGFLLNMTGSVEAARTLRGTERTLDSLGRELRLLRDTYREAPFEGDLRTRVDELCAFIPQADRIVPAAAQLRAWGILDVTPVCTDEPHWCPAALQRAIHGDV